MPSTIQVYALPGLRWRLRRWRYRHFGYPDELKDAATLNYLLWRCWKSLRGTDGGVDMEYYRNFVFLMYKETKKKGLDAKLPYFWYTNGPEIEWGAVSRVIEKVGYSVRTVPG